MQVYVQRSFMEGLKKHARQKTLKNIRIGVAQLLWYINPKQQLPNMAPFWAEPCRALNPQNPKTCSLRAPKSQTLEPKPGTLDPET